MDTLKFRAIFLLFAIAAISLIVAVSRPADVGNRGVDHIAHATDSADAGKAASGQRMSVADMTCKKSRSGIERTVFFDS